MIENISLVFLGFVLVCFLMGKLGIVKPRKRKEYPFVLGKPDPSRYWANTEPEPVRVDAKIAFAEATGNDR